MVTTTLAQPRSHGVDASVSTLAADPNTNAVCTIRAWLPASDPRYPVTIPVARTYSPASTAAAACNATVRDARIARASPCCAANITSGATTTITAPRATVSIGGQPSMMNASTYTTRSVVHISASAARITCRAPPPCSPVPSSARCISTSAPTLPSIRIDRPVESSARIASGSVTIAAAIAVPAARTKHSAVAA